MDIHWGRNKGDLSFLWSSMYPDTQHSSQYSDVCDPPPHPHIISLDAIVLPLWLRPLQFAQGARWILPCKVPVLTGYLIQNFVTGVKLFHAVSNSTIRPICLRESEVSPQIFMNNNKNMIALPEMQLLNKSMRIYAQSYSWFCSPLYRKICYIFPLFHGA